MAGVAGQQGAGVGTGGAPANEPPDRTRIPMYVHTEGYSFANILYSVQGYALPRPQRLLPLVVSLLVGAALAIRVVAPVFGSLAGLAVFGATVWYLPRLVEELESYCGRNPLVELFYLTRHLIGIVAGGTLFVGARRATGPERRRLAALFASERELAGVDGYKGRNGRLAGSLSKLGRTIFKILVRTAHPTGRRVKDSGDFDTRTDTRGGTRQNTRNAYGAPNGAPSETGLIT